MVCREESAEELVITMITADPVSYGAGEHQGNVAAAYKLHVCMQTNSKSTASSLLSL